ncbi:arsenate reductase (glutaredoxin) [Luteibacter aegosomatissinici]|uniref:arsenate reductase (glutaredoxin) n=1 Tax=Luteibacter aegosomatissinici TaxID=2911539 RepID=UPI001FF84CD0|nr:arsenate reductase (glutaredoxin) [Luteibacter aegosomatissinici]UPG95853.1 arsenate reductase (glutaredoxin) [Luteibacter aegosomatissinici]
MSLPTLWHNPRCSKSRETLALLQQRGVTPVIVEYLKTPPSAAELDRVLKLLGREPRELMRKGEDEYAGVPADADRATLIRYMVEHPKLIERPVFINGKRAAVGRPPEAVLDIV